MSQSGLGPAQLFDLICALVMRHSPSGAEMEIDEFLKAKFAELGQPAFQDLAGNLIVKIEGASGGAPIAITAHKDEIGAIVTGIDSNGQIKVRKLGGSFPWVYGEGVVDLLGDRERICGILSFGSRHVSHLSPQYVHKDERPLRWEDARIETKLTAAALERAGIRPGTRVVVGKHRKTPIQLGDYVCGYGLDNKASLAVLIELARRLESPASDVYLVATANEEIGALGALYFSKRHELGAMIALEICPVAPEYAVEGGESPVMIEEDAYCPYDHSLNLMIRSAAAARNVSLQTAVVSGFGSDASISMKQGHVARGACIGFPTQNTHGFEIAHLAAISNCAEVLTELVNSGAATMSFE